MILIDANVFMYAAGRESPYRASCRRFILSLTEARPREAACTDAEVLQEILHRYRSIRKSQTGYEMVDRITQLGIPIHPVTEADVVKARHYMERHPKLSARDAVHLGVMDSQGIGRILTYDRGFDQAPGFERVEPA